MGFFSEYSSVMKLLQQQQQVVVYAESRHYYPYFEKLITGLLAENVNICYITSDKSDPLLSSSPAGISVVYVKWMLGFLFPRIKSDVVIMTMPDLDNFLFKRSPLTQHYIYIFHAAVSTHQQYRASAFYHYDAIFCTGEYQQQEIKIAEKLYDQQPKQHIPYGYPLFETIAAKRQSPGNTILIAPSWFEGCIFDTCLEALLQQLSSLPYQVVLRSHPEYEKRKKKEYLRTKKLIAKYPRMKIDDLSSVTDRLAITDILITDRSGIALEFAFGIRKPVLFIDTALKQTNRAWHELGVEPIENSIRSQLGLSISPTEMDRVPEKLAELASLTKDFAEKMKALQQSTFYNSEESWKTGVEYVLGKINVD